jgi:hypothetical protein
MTLLGLVVWMTGCSLLDRQQEPQILDVRTDQESSSSVGRSHEVRVTLVTDDPDNDELDFLWVATGGQFKQSGRDSLVDLFQDSVSVVWRAPSAVGTYDLEVEVSDGKSKTKATTMVRITVTQGPPVADAGLDRDLAFSDTLQVALDGAASLDPDGDALRYMWEQIGGPGVSLQPGDSSVPSFRAIAPADYVFVLQVRDDKADTTGAITSPPDTVRIRVNDRVGWGT